MVRLQPDPFLNELTSMFERTTEHGSVWVTLKHSSDKSKAQRNKMKTAGENLEFKCLIRATDGKKNISTMVEDRLDKLRTFYGWVIRRAENRCLSTKWSNSEASIVDTRCPQGWNLTFRRHLNDREVGRFVELLQVLSDFLGLSTGSDTMRWKHDSGDQFSVGAKDHQRFQASYAILLKARLTALKKRERKDKRKATDSDKKMDISKKKSAAAKAST
ncbi:hypothetical protein MTR67_027473 [Solanum verrucosum]|uniref:Signal recognition particle 14 kDa protein n=1 Tax=Solanum verrucosum TaxID=315347 RepID=A0AAF0U057_SOLVR|nr:hypothetical protein MTR67_027473 [Solanum verrucosum]